MLKSVETYRLREQTDISGESARENWNFAHIKAIIERQWKWICGWVVAGLVVAALYQLVAPPIYTATTDILTDAPRVSAVSDAYDVTRSASGADTGYTDSQVQILKSERVVLAVIDALNLEKEPSFLPTWIPVITPVVGFVKSTARGIGHLFGMKSDPKDAEYELRRQIVQTLINNVSVQRLGRTFVIEVKFTWRDPVLAAKIANTFAEQYLKDQLKAKYAAAETAGTWLQAHIAELRVKANAADLEVQKFRADHNLQTINGMLVNEDQLSKASAQLADARQKVADAESKKTRIDAILASGDVRSAVTESLSSKVIDALRLKLADASQREQYISQKWGANHASAQNARAEIKNYEALLFEELRHIGETYKSDYEIAKDHLDAINKNVNELMLQASANNEVMVHLRELTSEADTLKELYRVNLERYQQTMQQESFPGSTARIIGDAAKPIAVARSPFLVLGLGLIGGLFLGCGTALARDALDRRFWTEAQVTSELGLDVLGVLPILPAEKVAAPAQPGRAGELGALPTRMKFTLDQSFSMASETMRAVKVAVDISLTGKRPKIIGVISSVSGEGKTIVSKNLATLIASHGIKTILIDGDLHRSRLTLALSPTAQVGLTQLLRGVSSLKEVMLVENDSGLVFLPGPAGQQLAHPSHLLASEAMGTVLEYLGREGYEYIIVDLPPLDPVVDVRAAAEMFDAFVMVVEWGKTTKVQAKAALTKNYTVMRKCIGVVLNKVDLKMMRSFSGMQYTESYYGGDLEEESASRRRRGSIYPGGLRRWVR
ncbi:polysaccharide biosynthesis tyrosine autokinase [Beijerinckia indica]|uniref:Capsular exopolysaccharide family n=1 Tax=Beijerinckia indica subsp. indica (strain ATCC 9039 / DSM 1715 / NCIMB 8712) TaxID=395963 RepID=B2ILL1_BEII9|nr:polysaccharide biosynthesis tyrosine autokinase [Beijerinckia indica]ACB97411.1 capsular exopolysaccharide family [Beijerinckia indica subsp. indica ATCC 9039]